MFWKKKQGLQGGLPWELAQIIVEIGCDLGVDLDLDWLEERDCPQLQSGHLGHVSSLSKPVVLLFLLLFFSFAL